MKAPISDSQVIVLEGADGTGKTTLAQELAAAQDRQIIHASKPTAKTWQTEYHDSIKDIVPSQSLVLDRWHIGEFVWPQVMNRESLYRDHVDFLLSHNTITDEFDAFTIIVVRPEINIIGELLDRKETILNIQRAIDGQRLYLEMFADMQLKSTIMATLPTAREILGLT